MVNPESNFRPGDLLKARGREARDINKPRKPKKRPENIFNTPGRFSSTAAKQDLSNIKKENRFQNKEREAYGKRFTRENEFGRRNAFMNRNFENANRPQYMQQAARELRYPVQGFSPEEQNRMQAAANRQIQSDIHQQMRELSPRLGTAGGVVTAQDRPLADYFQNQAARQRAQIQEDLASRNEERKRENLEYILGQTQQKHAEDIQAQEGFLNRLNTARRAREEEKLANRFNAEREGVEKDEKSKSKEKNREHKEKKHKHKEKEKKKSKLKKFAESLKPKAKKEFKKKKKSVFNRFKESLRPKFL